MGAKFPNLGKTWNCRFRLTRRIRGSLLVWPPSGRYFSMPSLRSCRRHLTDGFPKIFDSAVLCKKSRVIPLRLFGHEKISPRFIGIPWIYGKAHPDGINPLECPFKNPMSIMKGKDDMTEDKKNLSNRLSEHELSQFSGSLSRYQHNFARNVLYSEGVNHVAVNGEAFWLIDTITFLIGSNKFKEAIRNDDRIARMHFWTLEVFEDNSALLVAKADSPEEAFIEETIPFTDFPLEKIDIWAGHDGQTWTLYLPSEH